MGQVANVALSDTFDTWRVRSNQGFTNLFEINPTANTVNANTVTGATLVATSTVTVPAASIGGADVDFLANTNSYIATQTSTASIQSQAALANTNSAIAGKLSSVAANTNIAAGVVSAHAMADNAVTARALGTGAELGVNIQAYDADTAKTDVVQAFSVAQRGTVTDHGSLIANTTFRQDFAASNHFKMTLAGSITINNPTNQVAGQSGAMEIVNGGSYTVSFGSDFDFAGGTAPTITASGTDVLSYYVSSANNIVVDALQNLS